MTAPCRAKPAAAILVSALVVACTPTTSGTAPPTEPPTVSERFYPAPTSSAFTPAPFALPSDGRTFWQALREVTSRLEPPADGRGDETRRLQACDHLAQLANLVMQDDTRDYDISGSSAAVFYGVAFDCQDPAGAEATYLRLQGVLEDDPYSPTQAPS